ncbi:MAG: hypothetical protein M1814_005436 [Vezdaea aestivalis]|nr:MAG: hypothetical protein M1814_005436 [Vezdaea aestivalis]
MDSRLGSYGTAKSLSSLVQTPEAWAVVSSYTAAFHTGYDCYNAGKCGVPIVTPQASTAPSPSQSATQASKPSLNGMQIIVLVVCLLAFVAGLVLVLCYLYSKKPTVVGRRTGQRDDDSQEVMLTLLVHFMTQQGQQLDQVVSQTGRLNGQMERTNTTLDSLDQTMRNMLDRLATNHPADANPIVQPPPPMAELGSHTPPSRPAAPATPPAELSNSPIPRAAIEKPSWVQTLEAELTCPICSDIFLNPVVLMTRSTSAAIRNRTATGGGCLHTLCGHCAVQALRRDPRCPSCRDRVSGVQDHRQIRQIAEAFLSRYPEQRRSVEEVQAAERLYRRGQNVSSSSLVSFI